MKQSHPMRTSQEHGKVIHFLVILLLLSACQPLHRTPSLAQENNQRITPTVAKPTSTSTAVPSSTSETQAVQPLVEADAGDLLQPFDPTGNNPMSPLETIMLRWLKFQISGPLSAHPQQVALYRRQPEKLSETGASALFRQMGITGPVSSRTAEAGNAIYTASGQGYTMNVDSDSPPYFVLGRGDPSIEPGNQSIEARKHLAEAFLQTHHLPDFPYRIEPVYGPYGQNQAVAVAQMIDNLPLYQGRSPWIWLAFDDQGQLVNMVFQKLQLVQDGQAALRPVNEVWADLQAHLLENKAMLRILSNQDWQGDPSVQIATIDQVELFYYAADTGGMWVGSIRANSPIRVVQPVWRFTGQLTDGTPIEILAKATADAQDEVRSPAPVETQIAQTDAPLPTGMIKPNTGENMVNVRSGPGAVYDRIGALTSGQTVTITGRSPQWEWLRIHTDQIDGWVYSAYLTVDSVAGVPCIEQQAGDCKTSGLPVENDQAIVRIRAFRNDSNLNLTYKGEERNPNADLRKAFIYQDDQGSEYWVDQAALFVVQWTPKLIGPTGAPLSDDALRTQVRNFAFQQSPRLEQNANNLTFKENTKDPTNLALRWEDRSVVSHTLFPFLQIILRNDGQMIGYMNTPDVLSN